MESTTYDHLSNSNNEWHCAYCTMNYLPEFSDSFFNSFNSDTDSLINNSINNDDPPPTPVSPKRQATIQGQQTLKEAKGTKIAHINTGNGGLHYHLVEVTQIIIEYKLDVLTISETWLTDSIKDDMIKIDGYQFVRKDNNGDIGMQGVGMYIRDDIPYTLRSDLDSPLLMSQTVQVNSPRCAPLLITALYRHPRAKANFFNCMESQFIKLDSSKIGCIILGDFNIDYTAVQDHGSNANKLDSLSTDYGFQQKTRAYTRITENSATIIDLCFTNITNLQATAGVAAVSVADHLMNFIILPKKNSVQEHKFVTARNFKRVNEDKLNDELAKIPWTIIEVFDDINDAWSTWKLLFDSVVNQHCPIKTFRPRKRPCPWFNKEIENLKIIREQYHNRAILTNNESDWQKYKKCKNKITALTREAKASYFKENISKSQGNSKSMWNILKKLLPKCKSSGIPCLEINGTQIYDFLKISNHFNSFFVNIGKELAAKIPSCTESAIDYLKLFLPNNTHKFELKSVTIEEILKMLLSLSEDKATGLDGYQSKLLKMCAPSISPSLTYLFNMSLTTGQIPDDWKRARVSAIYKKGSKLETGNYRPISVLPIVSKIIEKIVHCQLYQHLNDNDLLCNAQSGFRKKFSTQTSLHRLTEYIYKSLDNGKIVGMVALDLQKAFDTVDHCILLEKLNHYGIKDKSHKWFSSYLKNRKQFACINSTKSDSNYINTGVPQGSILGPLLFILYINDLPGCFNHCEVNMYADDTAFYFAHQDMDEVSDALNQDLSKVYKWLCANKLSLHVGKTNTLLICNHQKRNFLPRTELQVNLNENIISQNDHLSYLGVHIDSSINFNTHIDMLVKKVNKAIGALKYCSAFVNVETRKTLYNSLVLPHFDYCATIWSNVSSRHIIRLQRLQNRAMRYILKAPPRSHIEDLLHKLKWMSIRQRMFYLRMILMWRIVHSQVPDYLTNDLKFSRNEHNYETSHATSNKLNIPRGHRLSIFTGGAREWNSLPEDIRQITNIDTFKKHCIRFTITNISKF